MITFLHFKKNELYLRYQWCIIVLRSWKIIFKILLSVSPSCTMAFLVLYFLYDRYYIMIIPALSNEGILLLPGSFRPFVCHVWLSQTDLIHFINQQSELFTFLWIVKWSIKIKIWFVVKKKYNMVKKSVYTLTLCIVDKWLMKQMRYDQKRYFLPDRGSIIIILIL